ELPLMTRRHHALLKNDNYYELARLAARHFFESHGESPAPSKPPSVAVAGGWWERWRLCRQIAWLWDLAYGPSPTRISGRRIARVVDVCRTLDAAIAEGHVRLGASLPSAPASAT